MKHEPKPNTIDARLSDLSHELAEDHLASRGAVIPEGLERETLYRLLFDSIDEAFCIIEVLFGDAGVAADYRFLAANPAFERKTGLRNAVGRTMRDLVPTHEPPWCERYGRIARIGEPERFEDSADALGRRYKVHAFRIGEPERRRVAVLFEDVKARLTAEAVLRESEARQTFLLNLSDTMRAEEDPEVIGTLATGLVAAHIGADRCWIAKLSREHDQTTMGPEFCAPGVGPIAGDYRFRDFPRAIRMIHDGTLVCADVQNDPSLSARDKDSLRDMEIGAYAASVLRTGEQNCVWAFAVATRQPRDWSSEELRLLDDVARRIWAEAERGRAEAALRESEQQQRLTLQLVPAMLWWAAPVGRDASWHGKSYSGQADAEVGDFDWLDATHPDDVAAAHAAFAQAFASGAPLERQQRIRRADGEYRWHLVRHKPVRDEHGAITRWFGAAIDVNELHEMEDRQQVLVAELQHRTRNLMGVVRALADTTMRTSADLADFEGKFRDRLAALGRVQNLLVRLAESNRITFDELLRTELTAHGALGHEDRRVSLRGPARVLLRSSTVQTLAMALHELSTNSIKHGALGCPSGRLAVIWRLEPDAADGRPWLHVDWQERGVAMPPAESIGSGLGRELIEKALPYQLNARTTFALGTDGLRCTMAFPVSCQCEGDPS